MTKLTDADVLRAASTAHQFSMATIVPERIAASIQLITEIVTQMVEKQMIPSPPEKRLEHMTEPELRNHLNRQLQFIKGCQSEDTVGSMLIIFQEDRITQYGATVDRETVPQALRELADRLEKRETVER